MVYFKKIFFSILLIFTLLSGFVYATDESIVNQSILTTTSSNSDSALPASINEDQYIYNSDSYTISDVINGNVFASTTKFLTNPANDGGIINGNLFVISSETTIGSVATYSNNKDSNGNFLIESINASSIINGNVYCFADNLTIEAGSEIHGDLYAVATSSINIEPNVIISGNVFLYTSELNLNGQIQGSAYIQADNLNVNYYSYINQDLHVNATNATLDGIIYRNAFLNVSNNLITKNNFKTNGNFTVNYAKNFTFSGKISGNATINVDTLSFDEEIENCLILGNLTYGTNSSVNIPDSIVLGSKNTTDFVDRSQNNSVSIFSLLLGFFSLYVYVLVVIILAKKIAPQALDKLSANSKIWACFGMGLLSMIAVIVVLLGLCVSSIGIILALFVAIAYLFLLALALPLFIYKIANMFKFKDRLYINKILIATVILFILHLIPTVGNLVIFVAITYEIGQILLVLFKQDK